jgi:HEPN domain-containing protein
MPKSKKFIELLENVKKEYTGKKVPIKYQTKYGKVYSEEETKSIAHAIAKKYKWRV